MKPTARLCSSHLVVLLLTVGPFWLFAEPETTTPLASELAALEPEILSAYPPEQLKQMLANHVETRLRAANQRSSLEWRNIVDRTQWESYKKQRISALWTSLGSFPAPPKDLRIRVTKTLPGEGFRIENLVFQSRPGLFVTANLYVPEPRRDSMPGVLICHSHHNPKTQGELQDMGMTWARLGYLVLVMDQLGHGERRQHPFRSQEDYAGPFRVGREDYHFRYNTGIQLHLVGESLIGWMVWDLMRGIDLLLARPGIDPARIVLMGSVAGGGDPAAVVAELDERVRAAVPFNFGGPQPETPYPLPRDAEASFNYAGSGDWESTRNLRLSCRDGFLPWVIVGSIAPRRLVYAHEFNWDQEQDPVWNRLQKIYFDFYGVPDHLDYTHGFGVLRGQPPQASHCNNIGVPHRRRLHQALQRWFGISGGLQEEYSNRRPAEDLLCMTDQVEQELKPRTLQTLLQDLERARVTEFRSELKRLKPADRRQRLQSAWQEVLGTTLHAQEPRALKETRQAKASGLQIEQLILEVEPSVLVPAIVLRTGKAAGRRPVVVAVAQQGKGKFLEERNVVIAELLAGGVAVCLPDLRGTGETRLGDSRGRVSEDTSLSATEFMLGQTLVGQRLADLRSVLRYLRTRQDLDLGRLAVWGDSFAPINPKDRNLSVPLGVSDGTVLSEPLGAILALLTALFEDDVRAVYARGGLTSFRSVLSGQFLYLPHDVVVPGVLTVGDLCDLAASVAPRPLALYGLVDSLNHRADLSEMTAEYQVALWAYEAASATDGFKLGLVSDDALTGKWLLRSVRN
jgi:dienelactone hydrolase